MHWAVLLCEELQKVVKVDLFQQRHTTMKRRIRAWAEVVKTMREKWEGMGIQTRMVMITLTYRRTIDYKAGDINYYMKLLKQSLGNKLLAFAWVAEMQARGAVHYHIIIVVTKGTDIPKPDVSGMWSHGMSKIETARTPFYLVRYVGKEYQKDIGRFPKNCRLYAASIRDKQYHQAFRIIAGLDNTTGDESMDGTEGATKPVWRYLGSSVTEEYADAVLKPAWLTEGGEAAS